MSKRYIRIEFEYDVLDPRTGLNTINATVRHAIETQLGARVIFIRNCPTVEGLDLPVHRRRPSDE